MLDCSYGPHHPNLPWEGLSRLWAIRALLKSLRWPNDRSIVDGVLEGSVGNWDSDLQEDVSYPRGDRNHSKRQKVLLKLLLPSTDGNLETTTKHTKCISDDGPTWGVVPKWTWLFYLLFIWWEFCFGTVPFFKMMDWPWLTWKGSDFLNVLYEPGAHKDDHREK